MTSRVRDLWRNSRRKTRVTAGGGIAVPSAVSDWRQHGPPVESETARPRNRAWWWPTAGGRGRREWSGQSNGNSPVYLAWHML